MKNKDLAILFSRMADALEFEGETVFKINAYRRASRVLNELTEDIEQLVTEGTLKNLPGIGDALQKKIIEYIETGKIEAVDRQLARVPEELFELLSIQNYGPKTAALANRELGVASLDDLQRVVEDGALAMLPGMGEKKVLNIKRALEHKRSADERISIGIVYPIIEDITEQMRAALGSKIGRVTPAGSVRRFRETVHDIDLLVETEDGDEVIQFFSHLPRVTRILGAGTTKASVLFDDRFQVDLRAIVPKSFGAAQQYFTGSKEHNVRIRELARKKGLKVNEYGVFRGETSIAGRTEDQVYGALDLPWIAPELREDRGEVQAAMDNKLPDLIEVEDIRGDFHIHSQYSDGQLSIEDMAEQVRQMGYEYMAFCDHSRSARYAGGLDETRLLDQIEAIHRLNEHYTDFTILAGSEVDIQKNGDLDFSSDLLSQLDFVIASIHSSFQSDPTGRICGAMQNPYVDVIAHPTGRLISRREGYSLDIARVIQTAVNTGTALEVNSFWDRLDLCDLYVRQAMEAGALISINTDAHHPANLPLMALGVGTARRGWAPASRVINTWSIDKIRQWRRDRNRS
jgi:DNA polymerase (family 10)